MKFSAYRLVLLLAALLCVAGCRPSTHYVTVEGSVLGTTFRIKARTTLPADEIYTEVMALDEEMKHSMSIFDETSLLSRINRGESDSLDSHLIYNILAADSVSRLSDGMYDITVKPLVEAWGFAGKEGQKTPNIDSILPLVGYRKIRIEGNRLVKDDPRIQLDFNSIGKGYMVDLIARMLERNGSENYLVTIAGSGRCRGVDIFCRQRVRTPGRSLPGRRISRKFCCEQSSICRNFLTFVRTNKQRRYGKNQRNDRGR